MHRFDIVSVYFSRRPLRLIMPSIDAEQCRPSACRRASLMLMQRQRASRHAADELSPLFSLILFEMPRFSSLLLSP